MSAREIDVDREVICTSFAAAVGFYACPCGEAFEFVDGSALEDYAALNRWLGSHDRCSDDSARSQVSAVPRAVENDPAGADFPAAPYGSPTRCHSLKPNDPTNVVTSCDELVGHDGDHRHGRSEFWPNTSAVPPAAEDGPAAGALASALQPAVGSPLVPAEVSARTLTAAPSAGIGDASQQIETRNGMGLSFAADMFPQYRNTHK